MSKLKCPFCQQEMICGGTICHYNPNCPIHDNSVPTEVLELLDRTRKALEIAKDTFNWIDETYQTGQDMEAEIWGKVQLAIQEITSIEQKDVK